MKLRRKLEERQGVGLGTGENARMASERMPGGEVSSSSVDDRGPARRIISFSGTNNAPSAAAGPRRDAKVSKENADVAKRRMKVELAAMKEIWADFLGSEDFNMDAFRFIDEVMRK